MIGQLPAPFRVVLTALAEWWRDWVNMAALNMVWLLCWLTVVLGPPATFVIYDVMHDFVQGRSMHPRELPALLKRYFLKSWLWMVPNLLVAVGIWANLQFYTGLEAAWAGWLELLTLVVGALWLALQFYTLPYLMQQDGPGLRLAYRNALLTILASPLYTIVVAGFAGLVLYIGFRLPVLLFLGGPCLVAVLGTRAVAERLGAFGLTARE